MRSLIFAYAALAVTLATSACGDGNSPDDVPRTVPPTQAATPAPDKAPGVDMLRLALAGYTIHPSSGSRQY